jgi:ethanolamine utilization protein EutA
MSSEVIRPQKNDLVTMVGLDFGSTTSSAMVAHARVGMNSTTGRMSFGYPDIIYRSEPVFTPFANDSIDESALRDYLDCWLTESGVRPEDLFSGGAIITGLATEKNNVGCITALVKERVGEAIIATASDPCLESWLAFMGSCTGLSRCHNERPILNFDIGGGTTNPALGLDGNVLATGCYYIGARHLQFEPGTYRLKSISDYGRNLMNYLGIFRDPGENLSIAERDAILDFYLAMLEAIACGNGTFTENRVAREHTQVPLVMENSGHMPVITFSGGVGELLYRHAQGQSLPGTTYFGDLGIDLARWIMRSPLLSAGVGDLEPENMGRATVYGLAIHSTEISGSTLFLPQKQVLPLKDLPIVGRMSMDAEDKRIHQLLTLIGKSRCGGAIQITSSVKEPQEGILRGPHVEKLERVKNLGQKLRDAIRSVHLSPDTPLVLIVPHNCGKSLGNYATDWRKCSTKLIVVDEILDRNAQFVNIGRIHNNIVPVSFYGVQ